jgi:hypothetical protein
MSPRQNHENIRNVVLHDPKNVFTMAEGHVRNPGEPSLPASLHVAVCWWSSFARVYERGDVLR